MNELTTLTKRHIKTYLRDKTGVFFSFLSIIILLAIYLLFLGQMFASIPILNASEQSRFTVGYIMGGVLVVGTITLSLGVLGVYVSDLEYKRINGFLVTPVSRSKLTLSYYVATVIVTLVLTLIMFILSFLYLGLSGGVWLSFLLCVEIIATLTLFVCIVSPIIIVMISFIKSSAAFGTLASVVGTLIGFISGIYIPFTMLDNFTKTIATLLPFSHMTMHLRKLLIGDKILHLLPVEELEGSGLTNLKVFGLDINIYLLFALFAVISAGLFIVSYYRMNKKLKY